MTYKELSNKMNNAGWGSHPVLCLKEIRDPGFSRQGTPFCTVGNLKRLDTYTLYEQQGKAPDASDWVGEPIDFSFLEPTGKGTKRKQFKNAWVYRDKGLVGFINDRKQQMLCALSDVEKVLGL